MEWVVAYDPACRLCEASRKRVETWAERSGQPIDWRPLKENERGPVVSAGADYSGFQAWRKLLSIAPLPLRILSVLLGLPVCSWLGQAAYEIIARNRIRWFGTLRQRLRKTLNFRGESGGAERIRTAG